MLNTANDLGNDGPDFIHGWGKVNTLKATIALEEGGTFSIPSVKDNQYAHHKRTYWNKPSQSHGLLGRSGRSTSAAQALVNDLDATVTDGSNSFFHGSSIQQLTPQASINPPQEA